MVSGTTFVGLVFVFFAASEALVRISVNPSDVFAQHVEFFKTARTQNVAFGDSHAAFGFTGVSNVINLAAPTENIDIMYEKVQIYFSDKRPGRVFLQADPHLFARYREAADVDDYLANFRDGATNGNAALGLLALTTRHRSKLLSYWQILIGKRRFQSSRRFLQDGALARPQRWINVRPAMREMKARKRVQLHQPLSVTESSHTVRYRAMIEYLIDQGAQVCLLGFPVSPEYRSVAATYPTFQQAREFFEQTARDYRIPYVSFWEAFAGSDQFVDMDHLREMSATLIAKRASAECFPSP